MNRAFYIVGIVLSFFYVGIIAGYVSEAEMARSLYYYDLFNDYSGSRYLSSGVDELTFEAGVVTLFFILVCLTTDLLGLIKVKTKTSKVLTIIGMSLSAIFLFWNFGMLTAPGAISVDEVGPVFSIYGLVMLAFSIVGLVQSVRFYKKSKNKEDVALAADF